MILQFLISMAMASMVATGDTTVCFKCNNHNCWGIPEAEKSIDVGALDKKKEEAVYCFIGKKMSLKKVKAMYADKEVHAQDEPTRTKAIRKHYEAK